MFTAMEGLLLERESALATQMTSTSVLTNNTTLSGTSQYTDKVNSDPSGDFDTARTSVFDAIGREPNIVLMNRKVANALRRHPFFTERAVGFVQGGKTAAQGLSMSAFVALMKSEFDVDDVIIAKSINITSKEGQTETKAQVWGNDVVFFYRAPKPDLMAPSFGYSFQLAGQNRAVKVRRHKKDKGDIVEANWAYQDNILDVDAAYLIKDAVA